MSIETPSFKSTARTAVCAAIPALLLIAPLALNAAGVSPGQATAQRVGSFTPGQALILSEYEGSLPWIALPLGVLVGAALVACLFSAVFSAPAPAGHTRRVGVTDGVHGGVRFAALLASAFIATPIALITLGSGGAALAEEQNAQQYVAAAEWLEERYDVEVNPADVAQILKTGESGLLVVNGHSIAQLTNVSDTWLLMQDQSLTEYPRT